MDAFICATRPARDVARAGVGDTLAQIAARVDTLASADV